MPGSLAPQGPAASSFSALLQAAYESEGALLDEQVQAQLQAALPHLPARQILGSATHLLLYVRSAVENFGQVSAAPARRPSPCVPPRPRRQSGRLRVGARPSDSVHRASESCCHPVAHKAT